MFYVGAANSIRAFSVRGVGPGEQDYSALSNKYANILRTGDIKFQANLNTVLRSGAIFMVLCSWMPVMSG